MEARRWEDVPIERLHEGIGRQVVHTENMTLARIHLDQGVVVPRHQHENEQVAMVLEGRMRFTVDDEVTDVGPGESIVFGPNVPHQAEALADSLVLDVFAPVREDWIRGDDAYLRGTRA
jgi:quercetin dioxygenase-like cupin family protein